VQHNFKNFRVCVLGCKGCEKTRCIALFAFRGEVASRKETVVEGDHVYNLSKGLLNEVICAFRE
jgi:hypothetical protein